MTSGATNLILEYTGYRHSDHDFQWCFGAHGEGRVLGDAYPCLAAGVLAASHWPSPVPPDSCILWAHAYAAGAACHMPCHLKCQKANFPN